MGAAKHIKFLCENISNFQISTKFLYISSQISKVIDNIYRVKEPSIRANLRLSLNSLFCNSHILGLFFPTLNEKKSRVANAAAIYNGDNTIVAELGRVQ